MGASTGTSCTGCEEQVGQLRSHPTLFATPPQSGCTYLSALRILRVKRPTVVDGLPPDHAFPVTPRRVALPSQHCEPRYRNRVSFRSFCHTRGARLRALFGRRGKCTARRSSAGGGSTRVRNKGLNERLRYRVAIIRELSEKRVQTRCTIRRRFLYESANGCFGEKGSPKVWRYTHSEEIFRPSIVRALRNL